MQEGTEESSSSDEDEISIEPEKERVSLASAGENTLYNATPNFKAHSYFYLFAKQVGSR